MSLELIFLGSGTSAGVPMIGCDCSVCTSTDPKDRRDRPSVLIRQPRDKPHFHDYAHELFTVLVDASPDIRHQSLRHKLFWLDALAMTHSHADHVLGLDDMRRFNSVSGLPLEIFAEPEVIADLKQMFNYIFASKSNVNSTYIAQLVPIPIGPLTPLTFGAATWTPIRLMHGRLPILGFRVDCGGRSIAYCTDCSTVPPETIAQLQDLDVLIIDGLREQHHPTHLTIDQACDYAEQISAKQTYLTHIAHYHSHQYLMDRMPQNVEPAYDGLTLVLKSDEPEIITTTSALEERA